MDERTMLSDENNVIKGNNTSFNYIEIPLI